jgi:LmbE family N-acetylglucosaminyl deacetylase
MNTINIKIIFIVLICFLLIFLVYFKSKIVHSYSYIDTSTSKKNRPKILILNAHPDDETLFGSRDLIENDCTVICFTHGENPVRRNEFFKAIDYTNNKGYIYNFPDSKGEISQNELYKIWYNLSDKDIFKHYISPLLKEKYYMVVSHSKNGEYGHAIHKRVHKLALYTSNELNLPFSNFYHRYNTTTKEERDNVLKIYKSQNINKYRNFYDKN